MKLSDLKAEPEAVVEETAAPAPAPEKAKDEPYGVVRSTTPSGIDIYYQAGPKRLYTLATETQQPVEVPSPSGILEVLEKGGLSWWGMKVGVEGVLNLLDTGVMPVDTSVDEVVDLLKSAKLTVNHVKGAAADRGTNVHVALESWAETGVLPDPQFFPEHERGYVRGLVSFLKDTQPEVEHSELLVASTEYGYAGRFDLVAKLMGTKYVSKCYPKNPSLVDVLEPGQRVLLDLKTSKGVYPSYHLQAGAYEGAYEESGYGTVDNTAIIRVTADGKYELVWGLATVEDFVAVLEVSQIVKRIEAASKRKKS